MTAPDLADVLAEVNRLRAERGMEPLEEMPKGELGVSTRCPLATSLDVFVVGLDENWQTTVWLGANSGRTYAPTVLHEFAHAFDRGAYPELVA